MAHRSPLYLALAIRSLSLLRQTYFQPDEFFQALEPAHWLVFRSGYLSWEWRERIRSWLWPAVFAAVYKALGLAGLEKTALLTLAPRVVCVIMAALTDYYTYLLASKTLGHGAAPAAIFLSVTSLFNAHALPRAAGTSIETLLTVVALYYWPFATSPRPHPMIKDRKQADTWTQVPPQFESVDVAEADRDVPDAWQPAHEDKLVLSLAMSAVAFCIRPTNVILWSFLGVELLHRRAKGKGLLESSREALKLGALVAGVGLGVLALSTAVDFAITGNVSLPAIKFLHQNLYQNISSFYGVSSPLYHLTQTLPILLTTALPFVFSSFAKSLAPASSAPASLRTLAWATVWTFSVWSCLPHAEWRFLHPVLPILLLFCTHTLVSAFATVPSGAIGCPRTAVRCYTRINRRPFWWLLLAPLVPAIYLCGFHGRAQITAVNWLRTQNGLTSVVELMPCHSTPWMSHLHEAGEDSWFLTCEPPLGVDRNDHITQQDMFYHAPAAYINAKFPTPPGELGPRVPPSHIVMFGCLLQEAGVKAALKARGYHQVWYGWNGFDVLQDEEKRRGGVVIWAKERS